MYFSMSAVSVYTHNQANCTAKATMVRACAVCDDCYKGNFKSVLGVLVYIFLHVYTIAYLGHKTRLGEQSRH